MKVQELMTRDVATCTASDNLSAPARSMWERDCGVVPVIDDERRVVAVVTDRDIAMAAYIQSRPLHEIPVSSAMSKALHLCRSEDSIETAQGIMRHEQVRRLPVVDTARRLVGVLTLNDLACHAASEPTSARRDLAISQVGTTLSRLCEHRVHATKDVVLRPQRQGALERVSAPH
jgi:CBS domain-containing protein